MTSESRRRLKLTARGPELRRYADTLTGDVNAAMLLVHRTLTHAFGAPGEAASGGSLKAWLKRAFDRDARPGSGR
jgi:DNA-directed RNA polymerase specialized sigma24 family protein